MKTLAINISATSDHRKMILLLLDSPNWEESNKLWIIFLGLINGEISSNKIFIISANQNFRIISDFGFRISDFGFWVNQFQSHPYYSYKNKIKLRADLLNLYELYESVRMAPKLIYPKSEIRNSETEIRKYSEILIGWNNKNFIRKYLAIY